MGWRATEAAPFQIFQLPAFHPLEVAKLVAEAALVPETAEGLRVVRHKCGVPWLGLPIERLAQVLVKLTPEGSSITLVKVFLHILFFLWIQRNLVG